MNVTSPALKTHYLSSILPYADYTHQQQFTKTKDFYKPQQFIWNNPHRTSKRMYPYYHKQNQEFSRTIKPKIQQLESQDRINSQKSRIHRLTQMRNETRQKFYSRQRLREDLQNRAGSQLKHKKYSTIQPSRKNTQQVEHSNSFRMHGKEIDLAQMSYLKSVTAYDQSVDQIRKLVDAQLKQNHNKTRDTFQRRKHNNQVTMYRFKKNKAVTKSQCH